MGKGRFAPTPSGRMHLGNVFASLLAWLSAKSRDYSMVLRIEDLDLVRTKPEYTRAIMDDLLWLGLPWDEGPAHEEDYGSGFFQSRRTAFYAAQLAKLGAEELLYPCFCSRAELHAANAPHQSDGNYVYTGKCRVLGEKECAALVQSGRKGAARVRVPGAEIAFTDSLQGPYTENLARDCGDFILRRSDGVFAYQLAAPADDGAMGITEVVRGRDLLASAPRQIWLMEQLGYAPPAYCHAPLLLAPDGRRLAKRDLDMDMGTLRARVKGPQHLVGRLAHLAGLLDKPEAVDANELIREFRWDKVPKNDIKIEGEWI